MDKNWGDRAIVFYLDKYTLNNSCCGFPPYSNNKGTIVQNKKFVLSP